MAELHIPVRINYLSCRICRNLLRNPATIPCGHNFCIGCIEGHWDEGQRDLSCPECGKIFPSRPNLIRNTTLTDVLRDTERSMSRKRKSQESAESLRDQSTADTLGNGLCWLHKISQDNYCITDEKIICALCASDKHNGHIIGLVKEERRRKQEELRTMQTRLRERLQEQQKQQENMKKTFDQIEKEANKMMEDCETIIVRAIDHLQRHCMSMREMIETQAKTVEDQIDITLQNLETKMEEIKKMDAELDRLAESENSVLFLQEWINMQSICENDLLSFSEGAKDPLFSFKVTKRAIDQLGEKLGDFCDQQLPLIFQTCTNDQEESVEKRDAEDQQQKHQSSAGLSEGNMGKKNMEPKTREDFLQYACELSLDPATAHKDLIISDDDKEVKLSPHGCQIPSACFPERFNSRRQVLCREGLQAERCYYEVEVKGGKAEIALAYKGLDRKSSTKKSAFGANEKSWSLDLSKSYSVSHKSESILLKQRPSSKKIGVYLEFKEGSLSFFEVSDSMTFLYKLEANFTEPLYPGFWLDEKCCIRICDLK
ncbi:PREDICTED: tripartite motif-containing protein 16-like protein isoform X1 [Cyprinodon variegatus]|uniref:tripartite motif-containing protein 16-like protein isoform X1 n=1 Tax=Cyprinodon variegatus TaxID=28743 RepID=UPI0007425A3E|nr:PREDICTED: tripartite motif-containing protein 16-like protein isoform X1 [Cyprinodon variegatus]